MVYNLENINMGRYSMAKHIVEQAQEPKQPKKVKEPKQKKQKKQKKGFLEKLNDLRIEK